MEINDYIRSKEKQKLIYLIIFLKVSYIWYSTISCLTCLVVGILVSVVKPLDHRQVDPRLIR